MQSTSVNPAVSGAKAGASTGSLFTAYPPVVVGRKEQRPVNKATAWPRPNYRALVRDGRPTAAVRVFKFFYDSLASKPQLNYRDSPQRFLDAMQGMRVAAEAWLQSPPAGLSTRSKDSYAEIIRTVFSSVWGYKPNDPCYFTSRHDQSPEGYQLRVVLGDARSPFRGVPHGAKLESIEREIAMGWPNPRPAWEKRKLYIAPRSSISVESRGGCTQARWPLSTAKGKGFLHTFTEHSEAVDWLESLEPYLVLLDRDGTRVLSTHATEGEAVRAVKELVGA